MIDCLFVTRPGKPERVIHLLGIPQPLHFLLETDQANAGHLARNPKITGGF